MKKAIIVSGVLSVMLAMLQSCGPQRKMPRPQRHPTPPKKFVMQQPQAQTADAVVFVNA